MEHKKTRPLVGATGFVQAFRITSKKQLEQVPVLRMGSRKRQTAMRQRQR
jgi:hypothetical protein